MEPRSQLALTAKTSHYEGQMCPKSRTLAMDPVGVKTLDMEPVGPHGPNDPFSRLNNSRSSWPSWPKRLIFKVKRNLEKNSDLVFVESFMDVRYDLSYGVSWLSRLKRPIFKVKRVPEQFLEKEYFGRG
uniref:Uncharacterized protein n=1 Tax=Solanum tuberosum TaxID=4113 RepID=M1DKS9_SOLTU